MARIVLLHDCKRLSAVQHPLHGQRMPRDQFQRSMTHSIRQPRPAGCSATAYLHTVQHHSRPERPASAHLILKSKSASGRLRHLWPAASMNIKTGRGHGMSAGTGKGIGQPVLQKLDTTPPHHSLQRQHRSRTPRQP